MQWGRHGLAERVFLEITRPNRETKCRLSALCRIAGHLPQMRGDFRRKRLLLSRIRNTETVSSQWVKARQQRRTFDN